MKAEKYTYKGQTLTIRQWSELLGISQSTLTNRITEYKWSIEKAIETPLNVAKTYEYDGKSLTLKQWSQVSGISEKLLRCRLGTSKWSFEKAITTPHGGAGERFNYKGKLLTMKELSKISVVGDKTLIARLRVLKWSVEDAVEKPAKSKGEANLKNVYGEENLTIPELSKLSGISPAVLRGRIVNLGWSVEKAITTPVRVAKVKEGKKDKSGVVPKKYEFKGKNLTLNEWSKEVGISESALRARMNDRGWSLEKALTTPFNPSTMYTFGGKTLSIKGWSKETGIPEMTLRKRLSDSNWSLSKTLTTPVRVRKRNR